MKEKITISQLNGKMAPGEGSVGICNHIKNRDIAILGIYLSAGSLSEIKPKETGVAHFLEHMVFASDDRRTKEEIWDCAANLGVGMNAYTNNNDVCYYVHGMNENAIKAFDMLASLVNAYNFTDEDVNNERGIIQSEYDGLLSDHHYMLNKLNRESAYPGSNISYDVIGGENIANITKEDLINFKQRNYSNKNITLMITGGIDENQFIDQIIPKFHSVLENTLPSHTVSNNLKELEKLNFTPAKTIKEIDASSSYILLSKPLYEGVRLSMKDHIILSVASSMFGGEMFSPLIKKIREEMGISYALGHNISKLTYSGLQDIWVQVDACNVDICLEAIMDEYNKFVNNPIDDKLFDTMMNKLFATHAVAFDNIINLNNYVFNAYKLVGESERRVYTTEDALEISKSITKNEVKDIIDKYWNNGYDFSTTILTNSKKGDEDN